MKKTLIYFLFFISFSAFSASSFWVGVGTTTHNFKTAQTDEKGGSKTFEFAPTVIVGSTIPFMFSGFFLSPGIGYAKFSTKDNTKKSEFILQYHVSQQLASLFLLQYGFSNYITKISGDGGSVVLNNGSGTATFYTPGTSQTTYTASVDIGGEFVFSSTISARLQFSIMRFLSSERRRVSHIITANYFF